MIRHGQSVHNLEERFSGWANCPLSEKGFNDAKETAKRLEGVKFDRIYSSDTLRAVQTRETIRPSADAIESPLLRELNVGELSGHFRRECPEIFGERFTTCPFRDFRQMGGESTADQMERVREFLKILESDPCDCAAVFCHEGTIRCTLGIIEGSDTLTDRKCKNGAICIFKYSEGEWTLLEWDV